jgi:hypothetical protein
VWGAVRNFYNPYWRARYEDDEWEDLTSTQLQAGMRLAVHVHDRVTRHALLHDETAPAPYKQSMALTLSPFIPPNFGEQHVGEVVRCRFATGWSRGTLQKYYPNAGSHTFITKVNMLIVPMSCPFSTYTYYGHILPKRCPNRKQRRRICLLPLSCSLPDCFPALSLPCLYRSRRHILGNSCPYTITPMQPGMHTCTQSMAAHKQQNGVLVCMYV